MVKKKLTGSLEENVLTLLCWDATNAPALVLRLTPELFSTRTYRDIAQAAFGYLDQFQAPPRAHLRDLLEDKLRKGDDGELLQKTIEAIDALAPELQPAYVLGELDRFVATRRMAMAIEEAGDALAAGELDKAQEVLLRTQAAEKLSEGVWLHDTAGMLRFLDRPEDGFISSGIDALDERGVHLAPKTMTLFIAPAKKGKSWWLSAVAARALVAGRKVLHITLENGEELTAQRYLQTLFAMTTKESKEIRTATFSRAEGGSLGIDFGQYHAEGLVASGRAALAAKLRPFHRRGKLLIKEFPTGALTVAQLDSYLEFLKRSRGYEPDVVLVDYPDLMTIDARNVRTDTGRIFKELRGIAVKRNFALGCPTQGNRASADSKVVNDRMVAEDYSKVATADTVLAYSQTTAEKQLGLARVMVTNARNAEDKFVVLISQSYATGQFCLDSVYMDKMAENELSRLTKQDEDEDE